VVTVLLNTRACAVENVDTSFTVSASGHVSAYDLVVPCAIQLSAVCMHAVPAHRLMHCKCNNCMTPAHPSSHDDNTWCITFLTTVHVMTPAPTAGHVTSRAARAPKGTPARGDEIVHHAE